MKYSTPILLAFAVSGLTSSCLKKKEDTKAKDVEAIVSGDETMRRKDEFCGADGAKAGDSSEAALDQVYARLPKRFTDEFPKLRQHIELEEATSVQKICKDIFESQADDLFADEAARTRALKRLDNLGACWSLNLGEKMDATPIPKIHVVSAQTAIHANLIPMVTYGIIELYVDQIGGKFASLSAEERAKLMTKLADRGSKASEGEILSLVTKLKELRANLATAIVEDLKTTKRTAALEQYKEDYNLASIEDIATAPVTQNLFFAEAVDSYYCSSKTRSQFVERDLTKTWAAIQKVAEYLDVR